MTARKNRHVGSRFADFLDEQGFRESVETEAIKRVIALQLADAGHGPSAVAALFDVPGCAGHGGTDHFGVCDVVDG